MLKRWLFLAVLLILNGLTPAWAGSAATVTVAVESVVKGPDITLGEIAAISSDDAARVQSLSRIKLGPAPAPGQRTVLTKELLGVRLMAAKADYNGIVWQVPSEFQVTTASQILTGSKLTAAAIRGIKEKLTDRTPAASPESEEIEITLLESVADMLAPAGNLTFDVQVPTPVRYSTPVSVFLLIQQEGVLYRRIPLKCTIRKFASVVVAAQPVKAREILTADKLALERRDVGRFAAGYITDMDKVIGLEAKRSLTAGAVLNESVLNQPIQVKRNSTVTIVGRAAGIEVTATGVALQDGRNGQVIQVRNLNSQRIIAAKVISADVVQVLTY